MHLTTLRAKWIHEQYILRAEQLGIQNIPNLVFSRQEFLKAIGNTKGSGGVYGSYCQSKDTVYINPRPHNKLKGRKDECIENTLIHELVHVRFKSEGLGHGKKFEARIRQVFNGKYY